MKSKFDFFYEWSWAFALAGLACLLGLSFCPYSQSVINLIYSKRIEIYPDILVCLSIFFGFTLTAISLIISMSEMDTFTSFRNKNEHAPKMWDSYLSALKFLGIASFIVLTLIIFEHKSELKKDVFTYFLTALRWLFIFVFIKSVEKLFWNFLILKFLIQAVKKEWHDKRTVYQDSIKKTLKANELDK